MPTMLKYLQNWFVKQCDGYWEHSNRILIENLDNPGWSVRIDLSDTNISTLTIDYKLYETDENDWYAFSIKDARFQAAGDPNKLEFLLQIFRDITLEHSSSE